MENRFNLFIINLKASRSEIKKRIIKRNKHVAREYFKEMDRWLQEHKHFEKNVIVDITVKNEDLLNLQPIFRKLELKIK